MAERTNFKVTGEIDCTALSDELLLGRKETLLEALDGIAHSVDREKAISDEIRRIDFELLCRAEEAELEAHKARQLDNQLSDMA